MFNKEYLFSSYKFSKGNNGIKPKMTSDITFSTFEILSLIFDISITILLIFQIIKSHHGDCRGVVVSKIQSSDGNCVTREAKLSIHESPHEHHYELERLNQ